MENYKSTTEILRINLVVESGGGVGVKITKKAGKLGQNLHENSCVQNSTRSNEKYKSTLEIFNINFVVEHDGGLGIKTTKKAGKLGIKFARKFMCSEFNQIE